MCHRHSSYISNYEFSARSTKDVDFALFKSFVNKFNKAFSIAIIGSGEPLLNKDFFRMVDYSAKEMRMDVFTFTNGMLLDEEMIEKIIRSGLRRITISLNGDDEEEFKRMTGMPKEVYKEKLKNIKSLISKKKARERECARKGERNSGLEIGVSFIIDKENYKKMHSMIKLGEELGVDTVSLSNFLPAPFPRFTAEERCITTEDTDAVNLIQNLKNNIKSDKYSVNVILPIPLNFEKRGLCKTLFNTLRVDGDGNIGGCTIILQNLEKNGKWYDEDVWNNEYFRRMRGIFLDQKNDRRLEPCRVCFYSYISHR
jgi:MoaA/NifB/PqqE/SkfB family radical SAM enzyme